STGFGTGHHPTTRYCTMALQHVPLDHASVLDVGTGSGVLAIAAARFGAGRALGIDCDPDAIRAARENLTLNVDAGDVRFEVAGTAATADPAILSHRADGVTANLTGTLLPRLAPRLVAAARPSGYVIVAGMLDVECDEVLAAFGGAALVVDESRDGEW